MHQGFSRRFRQSPQSEPPRVRPCCRKTLKNFEPFFSNPLNAGAIAIYATAVLAIVTAILFQLVLSARFNDRRGQRGEPSPETMTAEPPTSPSLTAEERASQERDRHLF